MADEKISDMTSASVLNDADIVPVVQGGINKKAAVSLVKSTLVDDAAFSSSWNGVTDKAPSQNAVYDELHKIDPINDGTVVNAGTGFRIAGAATLGAVLQGDGVNFVSTDIAAWKIAKVTGSDATTTGQTLVDITGLVTATLTGGSWYELEAMLLVGTSSGTDGTEYGIHVGGSGGSSACLAILTGTTTAVAASSQTVNAVDTASSALLTASSIPGVIMIKGFVFTLSTTPTISVQHLKVVSGTSTVKVGSILKYRKA